MGSALSPPLAIGTLAWMEHEWMQTLEDDAKARFRMKRYMDDVITVTAKTMAHGMSINTPLHVRVHDTSSNVEEGEHC